MESLCGVEIETTLTGTGSVVGVVEKTSLSVAVDADRRVDLNIDSGQRGTRSGTAAGSWIVGVAVLSEMDVGPYVLIDSC